MGSNDDTTMVSSNSNPNPHIVHNHIDAPFPTSNTLNENNYTLWSKVMKMRINGRKMWGYISGTKTKPAEGSEEYENWCSENDKVKGWLCDSMSTTLMNRYVCLETAKEVWDSLEAMYTDTSDETQIFELHRKCFSTKQTGRSLATYYDELAAIFQEIDQRNTVTGESVASIALLQKYVGRLRVHMFLSGLDSMYDQVRGEILRKDPPLTLEQSYQTVRRVSVHKQVMGTQAPLTESSVMALNYKKGQPQGSWNSHRETRPLRLDLECTHCGEKGHTKQKCYEVIGYPEWWDFTKRPKKNIAAKKDAAKSPPSVNVAQSGMKTKGSVLFVNSLNSTWLIDTGASDHMVNDSSILSSITPSTQTSVYTANGGSSPVIGEGSTDISESLTLNSVLIVPALEYNILSVSRITVALTCTVTFWPQFCIFQDIVTRQVLGCGVRKGNLYYLDLTNSGEQRIHQVNKVGGIEEAKANVVIEFQTPFQKLHDLITIPAMPNLEPRVFGCVVFVHIPKHQRGKLDHCAQKCVFLGYADFQKGYRCYDPVEGKVYISLDVSFRELEAYFMGSSLQGERHNDGEGKFPIIGDMFQELEDLTSNLNRRSNITDDEKESEAEQMTGGDQDIEDELHMNGEDQTTRGDQAEVVEIARDSNTLTPSTETLQQNVEPQVLPNPNTVNDIQPRRSERPTKGKLVKETQISSTSTGTVDIGGDGGGHVGGCRRWPADTVERKGFVIKGEAGWLWFWCSVAAADEICGGGGRG
ncbi:hypothetical protein LWI29_017477 [Acer saccharum]|uniref:CCHC-type domain-containing protein n=1 Tax=Acer saccharum TaxID=4024 RepID=A0AA39T419_ACESA|nr:hypothetical protein LWI29_017477 [Acer saccharum]